MFKAHGRERCTLKVLAWQDLTWRGIVMQRRKGNNLFMIKMRKICFVQTAERNVLCLVIE